MVTDPSAVRDVLTGHQGLLRANVAGKTLIQTSTIDEPSTLEFAKEAHAKKMFFLDCPVTGSKKQVEEAALILLAGGDDALIEKWKPLLLSMGKSIVHAGDIGKGTALKLCMNLIVAQMTTALCESVALAKAQNLAPKKIFDVLAQSPALGCGYFKIKEKALLEQQFAPAFSLRNMLKDVRFMDQAGKNHRLPLPVTQAVRFLMEAAVTDGYGDEDLTSVIKVLRPSTNPSV
jgi:3-hydroxyisobutyrate dehydrogenase-like beta-hydroxyacid dehydrogenase